MTWLSSSGRGLLFGGSTAPVKERRVLTDSKGLLGDDFDHIPVSIIFDVIVRTAFFVLWAMQHRWILLPDKGSPDVAPNPVFMEFASHGVVWVCKN